LFLSFKTLVMKKFFFFVSAFFIVVWSSAQNTSPYWSLAGNSNASNSTSKLGTTNAINLRIFTKNAERMRIDTSGFVGIGTTTPNSRLHVNTPTGQQAIRAQINGTTKFLVHSKGGVAVGSGDVPPTNGLYVLGNVGIGTNVPSYKLHVVGTVYGTSSTTDGGVYGAGGFYGVEGYASGGLGFGYGVYGHSSYTGVTGSGGSYGVSGYCTSTSSGFGIYGSATDNATGTGVYGQGYYGVKAISNTAYGVDGTGWFVGVVGHGSNSNSFSYGTEGYGVYQGGYFTGGHIGVQGYASTSSSSNYGVYGSGNGSAYAGYFSGTVFATTYTGSDRKLKKNVEDVSTALDIIKQLHPKVYEFRQDGSYQYMHLPQGKHYGLIAQELEQVLPNLVKDTRFDTRVELQAEAKAKANGDPNIRTAVPQGEVIDFKAVNYTELIPIIVKAMQEQQTQMQQLIKENDEKDMQISDLRNEVKELRSLIVKDGSIPSPVSSVGYIKQNTPNPFTNNSVIAYYVPRNAGPAQIKITDVKGSVIKTFIAAKGEGQINIRHSELSAGTYNYTLYVNNKIVDTKQMVIAK
jgi:hypothetical protein